MRLGEIPEVARLHLCHSHPLQLRLSFAFVHVHPLPLRARARCLPSRRPFPLAAALAQLQFSRDAWRSLPTAAWHTTRRPQLSTRSRHCLRLRSAQLWSNGSCYQRPCSAGRRLRSVTHSAGGSGDSARRWRPGDAAQRAGACQLADREDVTRHVTPTMKLAPRAYMTLDAPRDINDKTGGTCMHDASRDRND